MRKHPLRKFLGLTVLYSSIIVGIFVLQFKTESLISKSFSAIKFSLAQSQTESGETVLKNQIYLTFRGITFSADDKNPVEAVMDDGTTKSLELESWEESGDASVKFLFKDGGYVEFLETAQQEEYELSIMAWIPEEYESISIPCKISQVYNSELANPQMWNLSSKNGAYTFTSYRFEDGRILFSKSEPIAHYSVYKEDDRFTFENVKSLPGASWEEFNARAAEIKANFVREVQSVIASSKVDTLTEMDYTAFVAELSVNGKFNQAIDMVPDSFKKGNKRSYFSAPYFDNLSQMNRSLLVQSERFATILETPALDVFTVDGIGDYILREKKTDRIKKFLRLPSEMEMFMPDTVQAAAIISVYNHIWSQDRNLAKILEPVIDTCVYVLQDNCVPAETGLAVKTGEDTFMDVFQAVRAGDALAVLGRIRGEDYLEHAGCLMMNSALDLQPNLDISTVSSIYTILSRDNFYYPHTEILGYIGTRCIWAWTCARKIICLADPVSTANIYIDFPLNLTNYILFSGIPDFNGRIEIQSQMFRTDPRFEIYNSSGYVYKSDSRSLLVKSRHKSRHELIRLFYDASLGFESVSKPSDAPVIEKPAPASKKESRESAPAKSKAEEPKAPASQGDSAAAGDAPREPAAE